jgi:hypothetical protein
MRRCGPDEPARAQRAGTVGRTRGRLRYCQALGTTVPIVFRVAATKGRFLSGERPFVCTHFGDRSRLLRCGRNS